MPDIDPSDVTFGDWGNSYSDAAIRRVAKRIERFATNTSDTETRDAGMSLAAQLQSMLKAEAVD